MEIMVDSSWPQTVLSLVLLSVLLPITGEAKDGDAVGDGGILCLSSLSVFAK